MPLLDHFHPPLSDRRHWEAFHSRWASAIADALNDQELPDHLFAEPTVQIGGQVQVDVATLDEAAVSNGSHVAATLPRTAAALPAWTIPGVFPDTFAVQIINSEGGPKLVAAIELISPSNKDRPQTRRAFAIKCANYLCQGIPFIIIDVVTSRSANLHNEIMELLQWSGFHLPASAALYAAAYRPVSRASRAEIDVWPTAFTIGASLPSLPLYVAPDLPIAIDFEAAYQETCQRLRLPA